METSPVLVVVTGIPPSLARKRREMTLRLLTYHAKSHGLEVLVIKPSQIAKGKAWRGFQYDDGQHQWYQRSLNPKSEDFVVFDAMYLADLRVNRSVYQRAVAYLERHHIAYFNPAIGNKAILYRLLRTKSANVPVPWTAVVSHPQEVIRALAERECLWFKPVIGSGGRNMLLLSNVAKKRVRVEGDRFFGRIIRREVSWSELRRLLRIALEARSYFMQENVNLRETADGRRMDLRITVQRDVKGDWRTVARTLRIGARHSVVTNFHAGGKIESCTHWSPRVAQLLGTVGITKRTLEAAADVAVRAATRLGDAYPTLGLLGVDVGVDKDDKLYVYDCNSRPGRDILTNLEISKSMREVAGHAAALVAKQRANL